MNIKIALMATAACLGAVACGQEQTAMTDRSDAGATVAQAEPAPLGSPPAATDVRPSEPDAAARADAGLGQTPAVNAVQDAVAGPVGQANAAIMGGDTEAYLRNAALGDMYEIQAGQIALSRSNSAEVQTIARAIIDDHREMSDVLKAASLEAEATFVPPTTLDDRRQGLIDNLEAASPDDFDEVFLDQQEAAHEEALNLHEAYRDRGDVDALRTVAMDAIPMIETHLEGVRAAQETIERATDNAAAE